MDNGEREMGNGKMKNGSKTKLETKTFSNYISGSRFFRIFHFLFPEFVPYSLF